MFPPIISPPKNCCALCHHSDAVVDHKTFHRYTVRAKRGTAQSSRDQKGGIAPKSAGASLRRYNEAALAQVAASVVNLNDTMDSWSLK